MVISAAPCSSHTVNKHNNRLFLLNFHSNIQGFNLPSQMPYNIIFPTELNFSIKLRYVFHFQFSLTFKTFVTFVTFSLFQSNSYSYVVLELRKCPIIPFIEIFLKQKPLNKTPQTKLVFLCALRCMDRSSAWFSQMPERCHLLKISG